MLTGILGVELGMGELRGRRSLGGRGRRIATCMFRGHSGMDGWSVLMERSNLKAREKLWTASSLETERAFEAHGKLAGDESGDSWLLCTLAPLKKLM